MSLPDLDKLSKDRRDWLEVYGNQWGVKHPEVEPLTAEEKQALADALNPFARRSVPEPCEPCAAGGRCPEHYRVMDMGLFHNDAFSLIWPRLE